MAGLQRGADLCLLGFRRGEGGGVFGRAGSQRLLVLFAELGDGFVVVPDGDLGPGDGDIGHGARARQHPQPLLPRETNLGFIGRRNLVAENFRNAAINLRQPDARLSARDPFGQLGDLEGQLGRVGVRAFVEKLGGDARQKIAQFEVHLVLGSALRRPRRHPCGRRFHLFGRGGVLARFALKAIKK